MVSSICCQNPLEDLLVQWNEKENDVLGPLSALKAFLMQDIRMLDQHHKFDVNMLSYFLDAKLKQNCSQLKLKTKCFSFVTGLSKSEHLVMY